MTRCKAFYRKMKKLRDDPEAAAEFCEKESDAIKKIYAHIDFMDKQFPRWLDDDLDDTIVSISEGATRLVRSLSKTNPEVVDEVLEEVCQLEITTIPEVKKIIREKTKPAKKTSKPKRQTKPVSVRAHRRRKPRKRK